MKFLSSFILGSVILLTSCQTVSELTIEVKRPAEIIIPENVRKIAIVNNSMDQPDAFGHTVSLYDVTGRKDSDFPIKTAGLSESFISELAKRLSSIQRFEVYKQRLKLTSSKTFLEDAALRNYQISEVVDSISPDLIISLDRMLFESDFKFRALVNQSAFRVNMDGRAYPTVRVYDPKRMKLLYTLHQQDSLYWQNLCPGDTPKEAAEYFPAPLSCFVDLTMFSVDKLMKKLVPYSEQVQRYYFIGGNINMHDAANYVRLNRWDDAAAIWEYIYGRSKRDKLKAFTAANMALYAEISDRYDDAVDWAVKSRTHFLSLKSQAAQGEVENLNAYIQELKRRAKDAEKLDAQLSY